MHEATVNEFPFVSELTVREKSKVAKLWDHFQELKAITAEKGILVPPGLVAQLLGVSRQRVHQLIEAGKLEAVLVGDKSFITENSLKAWAEAEHRTGRPPLPKEPTFKEAVQMTQRWMAEEREGRRKR